MHIFKIIGWIGSFCFAACGFPQAVHTYRLGSASDISAYFLGLWLTGELCMTAYVLSWSQADYPLIFNYIINFISLLVILRYKIKPRS